MSHPHSVCYRIFNYGIDVGIRNSAIHTAKALSEVNPYQCLGPQGSLDAMNEVIRTKIPVAVIIMYKMELEPIRFYKYSEMLKVYKWLREHLNNWLNVISHDYVRQLPPIEELYAMEELCAELYPHLVDFYGNNFESATFTATPDRIDRLVNIMGRKLGQNSPVEPKELINRPIPFTSILEKILELRPNAR